MTYAYRYVFRASHDRIDIKKIGKAKVDDADMEQATNNRKTH